MESMQQNSELPPLFPNLDAPPPSSKKAYYLGVLIAVVVVGSVVFYMMNSKTTLYKGSLQFQGAAINADAAAQTSTLTADRTLIASALTDSLQTQIKDLEEKLSKTTDSTEKRILNAQLSSLKIQLESEQETEAPLNTSNNTPSPEPSKPAAEEPKTETELLDEFDRLIELFADALQKEEMDLLNTQLIAVLEQIDQTKTMTFGRPGKDDLILTVAEIMTRLNGVYGLGTNDIYFDKVNTQPPPQAAPVVQSAPAPVVTPPTAAPKPKAAVAPAKTPAKKFTSATIQGETGPAVALYPLAIFAANLGWYLRRKKAQ